MDYKILVVEDEQEFFFFYTVMLKDADYDLLHATDAQQAFEILQKEIPDLIILDLLLDQMSGDEFLIQLKSNPNFVIMNFLWICGFGIIPLAL